MPARSLDGRQDIESAGAHATPEYARAAGAPASAHQAIVVYGSRFGNTQRIAEALARGMRRSTNLDVRCISVEATQASDLEGAELLALGGPTEWGSASAPMKRLLTALEGVDLHGKRGFAFDTRYHSPVSGSAAKLIERRLRERGATIVRPRASAFVRSGGATGNGNRRDLLSPGAEAEFQQIGTELARQSFP